MVFWVNSVLISVTIWEFWESFPHAALDQLNEDWSRFVLDIGSERPNHGETEVSENCLLDISNLISIFLDIKSSLCV